MCLYLPFVFLSVPIQSSLVVWIGRFANHLIRAARYDCPDTLHDQLVTPNTSPSVSPDPEDPVSGLNIGS